MSYSYRVAKSYNNRVGYLADIWTDLASMGWTLHDDQSGSSYQVWKSNGEAADRMYEYIKIDWITANTITVKAYNWWNATTHAGLIKSSVDVTITTQESTYTGWIYGSKGLVVLMTKISTTYYRLMFGHFDTKYLTLETTLTAAVTSGAHKSLPVVSSTGFIVGITYQLVGILGEGRNKVVVESIPDTTHIVIVNCPVGYALGARIGQCPSIFGVSAMANDIFGHSCDWYIDGTGDALTDIKIRSMLDILFIKPSQRDASLYYLTPLLAMEYAGYGGFIGYNQTYILYAPLGAVEDIFYVGVQDTGHTATSGDATHLYDTGRSWTAHAFQNKVIVITAGTGVGQIRKIVDNDATSITVTDWTTNPVSGTSYVIADEAYRCITTTTPYVAVKEGC